MAGSKDGHGPTKRHVRLLATSAIQRPTTDRRFGVSRRLTAALSRHVIDCLPPGGATSHVRLIRFCQGACRPPWRARGGSDVIVAIAADHRRPITSAMRAGRRRHSGLLQSVRCPVVSLAQLLRMLLPWLRHRLRRLRARCRQMRRPAPLPVVCPVVVLLNRLCARAWVRACEGGRARVRVCSTLCSSVSCNANSLLAGKSGKPVCRGCGCCMVASVGGLPGTDRPSLACATAGPDTSRTITGCMNSAQRRDVM
jgi:hypothetical protein